FVLMHLDGYEPGAPEPVTPADKWIFSRLAALVESLDAAFDAYEFGEATRALYRFFWNELCDWYIEFSKARLADDADPADRLACQRNLVFVLDQALRLLHPIMPFVTEEIYQQMPVKDAPMLIIAPWPDAAALAAYRDPEAERAIEMTCEAVGAVRSARSRYGLSPRTSLDAVVRASEDDAALLAAQAPLICSLANVGDLAVGADVAKPAGASAAVGSGIEVYTCLAGHVDFEAERARLAKEQAKLAADVAKLDKKLSNPGFLAKAAPEIVDKDRARRDELADKLARVEASLAELG
ncbi:MAG: class I tRNA ligase family protein, partial [Eggerthellaceae bacterium]|nr:class I tRNA ligase family protein [Eggerthellaceae bacterium]